MRSHNNTTQSTTLTLVLLLTFCALPLSAADKTTPAATIGSVSSVGSVQLRGVALSNEGTLFSGDRLNVGPGSYARVIAGTGHKLEVGANSDVVVSREGDNTNLQMASGNVAFKGNGKGATSVRIGVFDVVVSPDASGNISFVGSKAFGVRITGGSATVRNTETKKSFVVQKGSERLVSLTTGDNSPTMAQLASTVPSAVPAPALPRQGSTWSTGKLVSVVAAAAGSATLITYFLARDDDDDDGRAAQIKALTNLAAIAQTAAQTSSVSAQASSVAGQAAAAISASSLSAAAKATLQTQVTTVTSQANSAALKIATLTGKISALQNAVANQQDGPTSAQLNELNTLLSDLASARSDANNAINSLNTLLTNANSQGVSGLPSNPNLQQVGPPNVASASVPV